MDYFLGLEKIHLLTNGGEQQLLRVELATCEGFTHFQEFLSFKVTPSLQMKTSESETSSSVTDRGSRRKLSLEIRQKLRDSGRQSRRPCGFLVLGS